MVHELHKCGYQRLRIAPGMNSSRTAWRCFVTPKRNVRRLHGAQAVRLDAHGPHYTTGMSAEYLGGRMLAAIPHAIWPINSLGVSRKLPQMALAAIGSTQDGMSRC